MIVRRFSRLSRPGNLNWRPALSQSFKHLGLKGGITQQSASPPTSALRLLLGISRLITELATAVAFKLSRYSRWRAIHNCRDLADCFPGLAKTGNSTAVFKRKLFILSSHRNTLLKKCCTWSVNLGYTEGALCHAAQPCWLWLLLVEHLVV